MQTSPPTKVRFGRIPLAFSQLWLETKQRWTAVGSGRNQAGFEKRRVYGENKNCAR